MPVAPNFIAQIARIGEQVPVRTESESGTNEFGNPEHSWAYARQVYTVRTYPNRNTEVKSSRGDRHRDKPVFVFPKASNHPAPPGEEDRIVYNGKTYEMQAPTHYESHVEYFGQIVRN